MELVYRNKGGYPVKESEMFKAVPDVSFCKNKSAIAEYYYYLGGDRKKNRIFHSKREEVKA